MPPHCDALDGPVVIAARAALDEGEVAKALPYVPAPAEAEVRTAYDKTVKARALGGEAGDVADLWFCETVVRLHRAGEGAPYTGLKPAGLDVGPVIPVAERAIREQDPAPLTELLEGIVHREVDRRFHDMLEFRLDAGRGGEAARAYVSAMLGLQVWAHRLAEVARGPAHERDGGHEHE